MSATATPRNRVKCRYCGFTTMRFRGQKTSDHRGMSWGERQLRLHVLETHEDAYLASQGYVAVADDTPWTWDVTTYGEQGDVP